MIANLQAEAKSASLQRNAFHNNRILAVCDVHERGMVAGAEDFGAQFAQVSVLVDERIVRKPFLADNAARN